MDEITEECKMSIDAKLNQDYLTDQQLTFLTENMTQNLEHARHIETERLTFVSFQLMGFGLLLSDIGSVFDKPGLASILIGVLLGINVICTLLLNRWADVFKNHISIAEKISIYLKKYEGLDTDFGATNSLYLFSNSKNLDNDKARTFKLYIPTAKLFLWFNCLMYVLLIGLAIYIWSPYIQWI
jgi:hypothetical protein